MRHDPNFKVPLTTIREINPHPNPAVHSLVLAKVYDFDVIISNKVGYKVGDQVVYFPVNSVLPGNIENFIFPPDSKIKLEKSRVKAVRIQKFVSQGLIIKWSELKDLLNLEDFAPETDLQEILKIVKYYPSARALKDSKNPGEARPKTPRNKPHENAYFKQYNGCVNLKWEPFAFEDGEPVYVTEKIHGTNFRCGYLPYTPEPEPPKTFWRKLKEFFGTVKPTIPNPGPFYEFCYGSNTVQRQKKKDTPTWYVKDVYAQIVEKYNLEEKLRLYPGIVIYGEIYGPSIQKGYHYGLKDDEIDLVVFDIMFQTETDQQWMILSSAQFLCDVFGLKYVPVLYNGPWDKKSIESLAQGSSIFNTTQKVIEGVVVKNAAITNKNRKKIKIINPEYLMKESTGETTDTQEHDLEEEEGEENEV